MNAERLHSIGVAIKEELAQTDLLANLQLLSSALVQQVNQPGQPQYQQEVARVLAALNDGAAQSSAPNYSPTWQQVLDEIGATSLLAPAVYERVAAIFARNQITPSIASTEVEALRTAVQIFAAAIDQLVASLVVLKIGREELDPGECEVGVLVPRGFVDNRLDKFSEELKEIDKIFGVFEELCTGSRPSPEIRSISSTDLSIFLDVSPLVGASVAVAIERIVEMYKKLLEIRKLKGELVKQGVEASALKGIETHATKGMDEGIGKLVEELIDEFGAALKSKERKHEIQIELKFALKKIATRIDRGFNIEVRMEAPLEPQTEEGSEADAEAVSAADLHTRIEGATASMQFLRLEGDPLLSLVEEKSAEQASKTSKSPHTAAPKATKNPD